MAYQMAGDKHMGWLHESGRYKCPPIEQRPDFYRRRYKARKEAERRASVRSAAGHSSLNGPSSASVNGKGG